MTAAQMDGGFSPERGPSTPCLVCGRDTVLYVDGKPRHLYCFLLGEEHPTMRRLGPPRPNEAAGTGRAETGSSTTGSVAATKDVGSDAGSLARTGPEQLPLEGPAPEPPERWRAVVAVFDPSGVYLPDGTRWPLPETAGLAEILAAGDKLRIGHPVGVGALVLTDELCVRLGLDVVLPEGTVGDAAREWMREALAAAGPQFLAPAVDAGWMVADKRLSPETRIRRPGGSDGTGERAFDLVLLDYLWAFDVGDKHIAMQIDSNWPAGRQCVEIARRFGRAAQLLGVPWQGTARQVGLRLLDGLQRQRTRAGTRGPKVDAAGRNRARVVTRPGRRPELSEAARGLDFEPETQNWARVVSAEELAPAVLFLHTYDRRNAYLADLGGCELGYLTAAEPEMRHLVGAGAVADAVAGKQGGAGKPPAGLFKLLLPTWPARALLPAPHPLMRADERLTVWTAAPTVELLCGPQDPASAWPGAGYELEELLDGDAAEAWVFPAQGRLLAPWYAKVRDAVQAARADGDEPVANTIKFVYTGFYGGLAYGRQLKSKRPEYYQPVWHDTIRASSRSTVWRRLWIAQARYGRSPVAVDVDEVAYLSTSESPAAAAPMVDDGKVGQLRHRKTRKVTDEDRAKLAKGVSAFSLLRDQPQGRGGDG